MFKIVNIKYTQYFSVYNCKQKICYQINTKKTQSKKLQIFKEIGLVALLGFFPLHLHVWPADVLKTLRFGRM